MSVVTSRPYTSPLRERQAHETRNMILAALTDNRVGGDAYDRAWPARAKQSMW